MQLVAGQNAEAEKTLSRLEALGKTNDPTRAKESLSYLIFFRVYAKAKRMQQEQQGSFADAFRESFRDTFHSLDSISAALAINAYGSTLDPYGPLISDAAAEFYQALDAQHGKATIGLSEAQNLIGLYLQETSLSSTQALSQPLIEEDDHRRYVVQDTLVGTPTTLRSRLWSCAPLTGHLRYQHS